MNGAADAARYTRKRKIVFREKSRIARRTAAANSIPFCGTWYATLSAPAGTLAATFCTRSSAVIRGCITLCYFDCLKGCIINGETKHSKPISYL